MAENGIFEKIDSCTSLYACVKMLCREAGPGWWLLICFAAEGIFTNSVGSTEQKHFEAYCSYTVDGAKCRLHPTAEPGLGAGPGVTI